MQISEDFLHFIWKKRLVGRKFTLENGINCEILSPGESANRDGPDFESALININGNNIAGHIEIHLRASDWFKHKHHLDSGYEKVILHVVLDNDKPIYDINKREIPVLKLPKDKIIKWYNHYKLLQHSSKTPVICADYLKTLDADFVRTELRKRAIDRLNQKEKEINDVFVKSNKDWNQTAFFTLIRAYGLKINVFPMEILGRYVSWKILSKERHDCVKIEAMLFGQAGLLEKTLPKNSYLNKLKSEYVFLKHKYKLSSMDETAWKYNPVRPPAMPDFRLAQFAAFLCNSDSLVSTLLKCDNKKNCIKIFKNKVSEFWFSHYTLKGGKNPHKQRCSGKSFIEGLIINAIAPFLYMYGRQTLQQNTSNMALELLEQCNPEQNKKIHIFVRNLDCKMENAIETQGVLQQYYAYCMQKKCMDCSFLPAIMKKKM